MGAAQVVSRSVRRCVRWTSRRPQHHRRRLPLHCYCNSTASSHQAHGRRNSVPSADRVYVAVQMLNFLRATNEGMEK